MYGVYFTHCSHPLRFWPINLYYGMDITKFKTSRRIRDYMFYLNCFQIQ